MIRRRWLKCLFGCFSAISVAKFTRAAEKRINEGQTQAPFPPYDPPYDIHVLALNPSELWLIEMALRYHQWPDEGLRLRADYLAMDIDQSRRQARWGDPPSDGDPVKLMEKIRSRYSQQRCLEIAKATLQDARKLYPEIFRA